MPEEIRAECARIRESWSEIEYYTRAGLRVPPHLIKCDQQVRTGVADWQPPRMAEREALAAREF